ncbi:flagellar filament capping protein FliD [Cellulomonas endophytica]|uniref:flagellar filament capping protein FliD n=1 Tax=Cellulomonas endophytica TaxID=2494735 RepID=UPI0010129BA2|nr:flagellar filament capping protein FliD [Cellulomonas endophytica]
MASVGSSTSSSTLQISGLVSGMDTAALVDSLIAVEKQQQTLLATKQSTASGVSGALKSLNTKTASLKDAADAAAKATSWQRTSATSSATSVTAVTSFAAPSTVSFTVDRLASAQSSLTQLPAASAMSTPPRFTVTNTLTGVPTTVTATSGSLADVLSALGGTSAGLHASAINLGTNAAPSYSLQLTSATAGAAGAFTVSYEGADGEPVAMALTQVGAAADAQITLFPGTTAAKPVTSATNTFSGLMSGVDVTVSKVETTPVTLAVGSDDKARTKLATDLVSNLNLVLGEITAQTASKTSTASDGGSLVKGGVLTSSSAVRALKQAMLGTASTTTAGGSVAQLGLSLEKDGTFKLDEAAFASALAKDPKKVEAVLAGFAKAVAGVADSASNASTGTLSLEVKAQESLVRDLGERVSAWDDRLALRRSALEKQYAALEVSLSKLQSQSTWLAGQLSSLSSNGN